MSTYLDTVNYFKEQLKTLSLEEKYELCFSLYHFSSEKNPEWIELMNFVEKKSSLICDMLTDEKSPEKEYLLVKTFVYNPGYSIRGSYTLAEDDIYEALLCFCDSKKDKQIIRASRLDYLTSKYKYYEAEEIACELINEELIIEAAKTLMDYYSKTRRYDEVNSLYKKYNVDTSMNELLKEANDRQSGNKREYRPGKKEYIEIYEEFLENCVGLISKKETKKGKSHHSDRINDCDYPCFEFIDNMDFDSFVAYDVETSGLSRKFDYVTEIGAIKVINGKVVDSKKYKFQELIRPYGKPKKIPNDVIEITGITNEMVANAREVKDVFNDFADFIEDYPLVGYNNKAFDATMIRRAGRYAHRVITNKQFDLLPIAKRILRGDHAKLSDIAKEYNIINPNAHRAYTDALTTAKVFMMIKNDKLN